MEQLKQIVAKMRAEAQERLRNDKDTLFPHVPQSTFDAVVAALGEISIIEARTVLYHLEQEHYDKR